MTQAKFISAYFLVIPSLLLLSCNPIELKYANVIQASSETPSEELDPLEKSQNGPPLLNRSAQKEFKEHFLSDSIDMVFVLDTGPGMEEFYQNNSFGASFLSQFQGYDWKLAYTDMSVDVQKMATQEEDNADTEEDSCSFLAGLAMTVGGLLLGSGSPLLAGFGIKELGKCTPSLSKDSDSTGYANGDFLPFEYEGEPVKKQDFHQITKNTANYNSAFDHSMRQNNPVQKKKPDYSAPILRQTESYPFLSMAFSMARALNPKSSSDSQKKPPFFRKDSLIVYVLITTQDMKITAPHEQFAESIESVFGTQQRFKLILITLTDSSPLFCNLKLQEKSTDSEKLLKLAKNLNYPSLDICSNQLGKKLFSEISKNLYSKSLLNN